MANLTEAQLVRVQQHFEATGCNECSMAGQQLIAEVEQLRKEVADDDEIIDDLRCAGAEGQTEIKRMWAQFGLIKDMLALAHEQEELRGEAKNVKAALVIAAKEYLAYPKSTSGGVKLTDEVIENLADEAEAGYDVHKLKPRPLPTL